MKDVATLLANVVSRGGLNLSDVAKWLDVRVSTVREWSDGRVPRAYKRQFILTRLQKLNELVAVRGNLIPPSTPQPQRAAIIEKLRDEHFRVLQEDTAG